MNKTYQKQRDRASAIVQGLIQQADEIEELARRDSTPTTLCNRLLVVAETARCLAVGIDGQIDNVVDEAREMDRKWEEENK